MKLCDYLDVSILDDHIAMGLVEKRFHQTYPLMILTYSRETVWSNLWDDVTEKCRGLIVNYITGEIVARPFEKFFNLGTSYRPETFKENLPCRPPLVTEKLDGSLGILWEYRGHIGIASKGSFHSEHAEWATEWYVKNIQLAMAPEFTGVIWPQGYTPIFEMICQGIQHHVIHYDQDRLVLLAMVNNETGEELDPRTLYTWADANLVTPVQYYAKTVDEVVAENRPDHEGYVLTWRRPGKPPLKVKVKHLEFLTYQKLVHSTTAKTVFEALRDGRADLIEQWQNLVTPYLRSAVSEWVMNYKDEYMLILAKSMAILTPALVNLTSRKEIAEYLQEPDNQRYQHVCFAVLDEKDYKPIIWDMVEPLVKRQVAILDYESEEQGGYGNNTNDGDRGADSGASGRNSPDPGEPDQTVKPLDV